MTDSQNKLICEGKISRGTGINLFEGVSFEALQSNDDYDGDGIKNGDEAKLSFNAQDNSPYICYVSDPCSEDGDSDGIPDSEDTAPFCKGLADGVTGTLTLVTTYNTEDAWWNEGHVFLVYQSYINDEFNFSGLTTGWSRIDNSEGWTLNNIQRDLSPNDSYSVKPGEYVTLGNGALDSGFTLSGDKSGSSGSSSGDGSSGSSSSGSSSGGSSSSGNGSSGDGSSGGNGSSGDGSSGGNGSSGSVNDSLVGEANGVCYNMEVFKYLSPDYGFSYLDNTYLSQEITESDFENTISYFSTSSVNYWNITHNCAFVASEAWNKISDITVNPYNDDLLWGKVASPKGLKLNLRSIDGHCENFSLGDAMNLSLPN